jgi:hypothetical protein
MAWVTIMSPPDPDKTTTASRSAVRTFNSPFR